MLNFFKNLRVRQWIMLPNVLAVMLMVSLVTLFIVRLHEEGEARAAVQHVGKMESAIHALMEDLLNIETGERGFILSGDAAFLEPYQLGKQRFQSDLADAFALTQGDVDMSDLLRRFEAESSQLVVAVFDPLVLRRHRTVGSDREEQGLRQIMAEVSSEKGKIRMDRIRKLADQMVDMLQKRLLSNEAVLQRDAKDTVFLLLALLLIFSLLLLWIGWYAAQRIGQSVTKLTEGANAIAGGDLSYDLEGDYPANEIGVLADALLIMRNSLATTLERLGQKNWLAEREAKVGKQLQSVMDQKELAGQALTLLEEELEVVCAVFYAAPMTECDELQLVLSRNCAANIASVRSMKNGVLARCRDDHRVHLLSPVPPSYLTVSSALGCGDPGSVVVIPLAFENELMAVIELATFSTVSELHLQLLQRLAERIAGVLYGVRVTMRMQKMLGDSDILGIALQDKADELERVSSYKSHFLASMSHEIRTPMNAILGMGELLEDTPLDQDQREYLSILRNSGDGLLRIINDVLDISKIEAGELTLTLQPFDLLALLERTSEMMAVHAHKKGLEMLLHVDDGLPAKLLGDEGRIQQVLINLLGNAVKFTIQGEVALHLHVQEQFTNPQGGQMLRLLVEVIDSGIGIPQEKLNIIFDAFTQADSSTTRRFGGTGLGLSISRQLVHKMDGKLEVQSTAGEGSCFSFNMVLASASDQLALPHPARSTEGRVMLVVDDHAQCRAELAELLSRWGVEVLQAESGAAALLLLERRDDQAAAVDLLLADCDMDGMDGFALVDVVRQRFPKVADVLFMVTTDHLSDYQQRAQAMGVELILTKPVRPSLLLDLLLKVLQNQLHEVGGLPLVQVGASLQMREDKEEASLRTLPNMRVLIAEDDLANQTLISRIMQRWQLKYTIVDNGQEALLLMQHQPFDLLLMDVNMPVMDGLEATRKIRGYEAEQEGEIRLPIVALTALAFAEDERKCLEAGMDDFLTKPIRQKMLYDMVWKMIDAGVVVLQDDEAPLFDRYRALKMNDDDETLLAMLVDTLKTELPQQLEVVRAAVESRQCEQVMRTAHKLKGALATLGVTAVQEAALALELLGKGGDADRCVELFEPLESLVIRLQQELS